MIRDTYVYGITSFLPLTQPQQKQIPDRPISTNIGVGGNDDTCSIHHLFSNAFDQLA